MSPFYIMYGYYPNVGSHVEDNVFEGEVLAATERVQTLLKEREVLE